MSREPGPLGSCAQCVGSGAPAGGCFHVAMGFAAPARVHAVDCDLGIDCSCEPQRPTQPRGSDGRYASEEPRSVAFVVRCTAEERERWKAAAGAEGLSAKVRRLLDDDARMIAAEDAEHDARGLSGAELTPYGR